MESHKNKTRILGTIILLTLLLSLLFPTATAFADDSTPPADTSEEVSPEEESVTETETPEGEEQVGDEQVAEETVTEETLPEETATAEAVEGEPVTDDPAPEETGVEAAEVEEEPVLAQVPDGTDVVVLNEDGEMVSLATQEAAEAIASSDPMWCPDGVNPIANTGGCTDSYSSMTDLLAALSGAGQPMANGTIWIEATYDSSVAEPGGTTNITIDGNSGNFSTWGDYSLTVQGGWNGSGSGTITGTSLFSGDRFRIINWRNDVTINDIVLDGASGGASLEIEIDTPSTNNFEVTLDNVEAKNNVDNVGVYVDNDESTGSVTVNDSSFTSNGNNDDGLQINAMGNVTLQNIIATGNGDEGVQISNTASSSAATVQVLGTNVFTGNNGDGLYIRSDGNITLNNITADGNNDGGIDIDNTPGSTNATFTLTGTNSFSGNTNNGANVLSEGVITLSNITANGNTNGTGAYFRNDYPGAVGGVILSGVNTFNGNYSNGLVIDTSGAVSLENVTADGNTRGDGVNIDNCSWGGSTLGCLGSGDVTLTGTLVFTNNGNGGDEGLYIYSNGNVSMADVTATGNNGDGVEINNTSNTTSTTSATVQIGGTNVFTGNNGYGLLINSKGNVGLNNLTADTNNYGTYIYNNASTTNATVTITGANSFSGNTYEGLYIYSKGAIDLSNITANGNTNGNTSGTGAYLRNDYTGAVGGVTISGTNSFSGNDASGLVIDSRGAVSLTNIIANSNIYGNGVNIENCNYSSGACQGSGDVNLTGTLVFTNNGDNDDGLYISTSGNVSMADVTATGNGDEGVQIVNSNSTTNATVFIGGTNVFTGNRGYGLYVTSKGAIMASNITAVGSINDSGARLNNDQTGAVGGITITGTNSFSGNFYYGLEIDSKGPVNLNNVSADNNVTQFGANIYNGGTSASGDVTITGTNSFSGNDDYGLVIGSKGAVSINNVSADGNKTSDGVNIDNDAGTGNVTLTGTLSFSNNGNGDGDDGLYIDTKGNVVMANVTATGNRDEGVEIYNTDSTTNSFVQIGGTNVFSGNIGYGLYVLSKGDINLSNATSDGSVNDSGAYLNNNQSGAVGDIAVTGTNSFSGNGDYGIQIYSRGAVTLENITANGNKTQDGAYIDNDAGPGNVTISGTNSFSGNGDGNDDDGLFITSQGDLLLENITADGNLNYGAYLTNTASSSNATVTMNGVNSFSNNLDDGLVIRSDGAVTLNDVTADGNGTGSGDRGADIDNSSGSGDVLINGYFNSFSNNAGPGLDIDTKGDIFLSFASVENNNQAGGTDGALFDSSGVTSGAATVFCSVFANNSGDGLDAWNYRGSLEFRGMDGFTDYNYNGTASFTPDARGFKEDCFIPVYGCMDPTANNYNPSANVDDDSCKGEAKPEIASDVLLIPVTGGQQFPLSCETSMTKLQMVNGDFVTFAELCGYDAILEVIPEEGLPGELGDGEFTSSLNVVLLHEGDRVEPLPVGTEMTVAFKVPGGMEDADFAILRWDGNDWVEESVNLENGYVTTTSSHTGTYVLVVK